MLPVPVSVSSGRVTSSRKLKEKLYLLSTTCPRSGHTECATSGHTGTSAKCNFAALLTRTNETLVETVHATSLSQSCIDHLRCQQYITCLAEET